MNSNPKEKLKQEQEKFLKSPLADYMRGVNREYGAEDLDIDAILNNPLDITLSEVIDENRNERV